MKQIYFLMLLSFVCLSTNAQETIYNISATGDISPAVSTTKSESVAFHINKSYSGKKILVLSEDRSITVNPGFAVLNTDFQREPGTDYFSIVIKSDHTIEHCTGCVNNINVSDIFLINLDGKEFGPFHLKDISIKDDKAYQAGSVIDDAFFIATSKDDEKIREILEKQYQITKDNIAYNFFLKGVLQDSLFSKEGTHGDNSISLSSIANTVGGLDVTNIADGFAKFIVKRTKQELSIAFFRRFKEDIATNGDLKAAFPNTSEVLQAIDDQIYNYSNYINNLREAFRSDLQVIDENLPVVIDNHADFFDKPENVGIKVALKSAFYITSSFRHKMHPGDILDGYPTHFFDKTNTQSPYPEFYSLKGSVKFLQLLSESLKETDTTKHTYWVKVDKVRKLVNDPKVLQIYIGLILQEAKNKYDRIKFSATPGNDFYTVINTENNAKNFAKDYQRYKQYILGIGNKVEELNVMIKEYDKMAPDSLKVEQYAKYFKTTIQLLQSATDISSLPYLENIEALKTLKKDFKGYFDVAYQVADLTISINRKNYPEVVNHLVVIYNKVYAVKVTDQARGNKEKGLTKKDLTKREKIKLADEMLAENAKENPQSIDKVISNNVDILNAVKQKDQKSGEAAKTIGLFVQYGAFMANMINAKTSDEVEAAIESVALPVGSASIKRKTRFNVSLNAYCGLFVGNEAIKGVDKNKPFEKFNGFGVTAPIGISVSRGNYLFFLLPAKGWSSSVFLSLVDLGAVAAYRFEDDKTEQVPEIKLKDIFSPGVFLSFGIPKTPLSFNFGAQIGPNLRKVTSDLNDFSNKLYTRYSLSVCVDIPLLNLYTKSNN